MKKEKNIVEKEDEIIDSYEEELDSDDYYDEDDERETRIYKKIRRNRLSRMINVIFTLVIIILVLIACDVLLVSKANIGPFLAFPIKTYKDGGTKEYIGLGYKVIKYKQTQGRRDTVLGPWSLKYNATPISIDDIDLAIEIQDNKERTYEKYINEFVRINSNLLDSDKEKRKYTLGYYDDGEKYSIEIICSLIKGEKWKELSLGNSTSVIGIFSDFKEKKKDMPNRIYLKNCFIEQ